MRYCVGDDIDDEALIAGLRTFKGIKDELNEKRAADFPRLLRIYHRLRFDDRFAKLRRNLFECLDNHNCMKRSCLVGDGTWAKEACWEMCC